MPPPLPLIIDTDPGKDDALAILMALGAPDLVDVLMLGTVGGNVPVAQCTANALQLCALGDRPDIPVHAGCEKALLRPANAVFHIHGDNGLGGVDLQAGPAGPAPGHAVPAMIEAIRRSPAPVTIAALAPLTNIALALAMAPDIVARIADIVVMGGAFGPGNITPFASYNMHSDPHAARIVFDSGAPITMIGLDVTRQAVPTTEWLSGFGRNDTPLTRFCRELWRDPPLCFNDACVIARILDPRLFDCEMMHVEIETDGTAEIGRTRRTDGKPNANVAVGLDRDGYFETLARALSGERARR